MREGGRERGKGESEKGREREGGGEREGEKKKDGNLYYYSRQEGNNWLYVTGGNVEKILMKIIL